MKWAIDIIFIVLFLAFPLFILLAIINEHNIPYRVFFLKLMLISLIPFMVSFFRMPIRYPQIQNWILNNKVLFFISSCVLTWAAIFIATIFAEIFK